MSAPAVSVVVVSLHRPTALRRCLLGIEQLDYPRFEVIVVADTSGLDELAAEGLASRIKTVAFDTPNISKARNLGLSHAAGGVVAFIDDDAVPEPTWLSFLTEPFEHTDIDAAGGFVIGRNGISLQYKARSVDSTGLHEDLAVEGDGFAVFDASENGAIKTEGTNCAFRRDTLLNAGGFDPAFAFYMDETDLNLRLAQTEAKTAIVPFARVHHGFAASARRTRDRMPKTLFDIGASQVVLLRKHTNTVSMAPVLDRVRAEQCARLIRHMVAGTCEPRDIARLMATLEAGFLDGKTRPIRPTLPIQPHPPAIKPFEPRVKFKGNGFLAGRSWQAQSLRRKAGDRVRSGERTTLFLFSPTALFHHVRFTDDGVWEQTGGLFGRSDRSGPLFKPARFYSRLSRETQRIARVRGHPTKRV